MIRRINFFAGPGAGKCFGKNTPILMYDGTIKMCQDVEVGDVIMGDDSSPRNVLETHRGEGRLFKVVPIKGDPYVVNSEHLLCLKSSGERDRFKDHFSRREDGWFEISTSEWINESKCFKTRLKGVRAGANWNHKEVKIPPYILGCWLGDGHSSNTRFTTMDKEVLKAFKLFALSRGLFVSKIKTKKSNSKAQTYSVTTQVRGGLPENCCNSFLQDLRHYDLINNKHIPLDYLANDKETRIFLLAGLLDTDGHASRRKTFEFVNKSKQLAEGVVYLARSLGFAAYMKKTLKHAVNGKNKEKKIYWRVMISGNCFNIPVKITRKKCLPRNQEKNVLVTGISIKRYGTGQYFGFEVDGNKRFLLGDFTVVHNSTFAAKTFAALKIKGYDVEHVSEFVKTMAHEGRFPTSYDQLYIFGEQVHREDIALRHVKYVVTDCPILLCGAYAKFYGFGPHRHLCELAREFDQDFPSLNFYLRRTVPYVDKGRYQTLSEAKDFDRVLLDVMETYLISHSPLVGEIYDAVTIDQFDEIIDKIESVIGKDS
jgi:hypothetical protein